MEEMVYTDSFSFKVKPVNLEENKEKKTLHVHGIGLKKERKFHLKCIHTNKSYILVLPHLKF